MGDFSYVFLDEGGNFDFSTGGTKYFTLTAVSGARPFQWDPALVDLRYDLLEDQNPLERFHASEDREHVRDRVFRLISAVGTAFRIDSVVVEKRKTHPSIRAVEVFYPRMLAYLIRYVVNGLDGRNIIVITDSLPNKKKRRAIEKGVKQTLSDMLPSGRQYSIYHHESKSCAGLQVADYCNWTVYRRWTRGDTRYWNAVEPRVMSEFDIFANGSIWYY